MPMDRDRNPRSTTGARKRTAVLVVHGMGSQRPLDTVRGVVDAVWLDGNTSGTGDKRIWTHPERSGIDDIDLSVITTNFVPDTDHRVIDFHELYWAHLMSETLATAVLLWLFELARMGPRLKPAIAALYWATLVFLCALILSVTLLSVQAAVQFAKLVALSSGDLDFDHDLHSLVFVVLISIFVTFFVVLLAATLKGAGRLMAIFGGVSASILLFALITYKADAAETFTNILVPAIIALIVIKVTMDWWGVLGLLIVLVLSAIAGGVAWHFSPSVVENGRLPWSIMSFWSSIAACCLIGLYLALYASFLQPYLGDAARYFRNSPANVAVRREIRRQAVRMLEELHLSGTHDRIVVVAHSLGTVVAYDMLRAYYSRINDALPDPSMLGAQFDAVDHGTLEKPAARAAGREIIAEIAKAVEDAKQRIGKNQPLPSDDKMLAWLVTDFITLGSPLTHALYLMCQGNTEAELEADFDRRTREREFPTCPPRKLDDDYRLTFQNPDTHQRTFHHGGQFALTRWTNLYFPAVQLFWGDAIGGPVAPLFGKNVADCPVYTNVAKKDAFFSHVLYWSLAFGNTAPHIVTLKKAIDLADKGTANDL